MAAFKSEFVTTKPGRGERVELRNGRVVDVEAGQYFDPEITIVIKDGRIEALPGLPGQPTDITADISYDLRGKTVLPGLFNTHAHFHLKLPALLMGLEDMKLMNKYREQQLHKEMADCLARGITTIRDCVTDDLRDTVRLREAIEGGELPGPRVIQAVLVGALGGTWTPDRGLKDRLTAWAGGLPYVPYDDPASGVLPFAPDGSEVDVRATVDRAIDERGADLIKIYEQRAAKLTFKPAPLMTEKQLTAVADQARKRGVPCTAHYVSLESFRRLVSIGLTSMAHVPLDEQLTDADLGRLTEAGCLIEPTMSAAYGLCFDLSGTAEGHREALARLARFRESTHEQLAETFWIPELRGSVVRGIQRAQRGKTRFMGLMDLAAAFRFHVGYISTGAANLRRIVDRGIPLGCGNDGGVPPCTVAMVAHELAMLDHALNVGGKERFTARDALRTATIDSARAVGLAEDLGSIAAGKFADLVVVDGDPLVDRIVVATPAAAVFKEGRLLVDAMGLSGRDGE